MSASSATASSTISRSRGAILAITSCIAAYVAGGGLHRRNAVYRRRRTEPNDDLVAAQLRPLLPGENDDANIVARPLTDGDTVVNGGPEDEDEFGLTGRAPTAEEERNGQNIVSTSLSIPAPSFGPRQIQPVWYCGEPDNMDRVKILPKELITKYSHETGFERPELEAYFEQWNFMANTPWPEDPDDIRLAMDRRTFDRCLVPSGGYRNNTPSLIFDRMFAFYDSNRDDLISFPEFLRGQAYRKQKDKWRKTFCECFDPITFLYRQMHRDMLEGLDEQQMMSSEAHSQVNSRGALGQLFGQGPKSIRRIARWGVLRPSANDTGNRDDTLINFGLVSTSESRSIERTRGYWRSLMERPVEQRIPDAIDDITEERLDECFAGLTTGFNSSEDLIVDETEAAF
ncbi:hypothetical protein DID88_009322 [Monilinia fructigena]|uniref:EF-hand domain-containing protein n=1 Tax=Monilinia fructigena TaxID=38457 RepID=A0A395IEW4_9HELO|nr:hypothetical protein DID88_009322 [Monilinia fructigena]